MKQTGRQGVPIQSNCGNGVNSNGVFGRLITILLLSPAWITNSCFIVTTLTSVACFPHLLHQIYNKNVKENAPYVWSSCDGQKYKPKITA